MDTVIWNADLCIGIGDIDAQHHRLIDIRNRLAACHHPDAVSQHEEYHRILSELFEYTREHFQAEEDYMQSIEYPALADQRKEPAQFIESLRELSQSASQGTDIHQEGVRFLTQWLLSHIRGSDLHIRNFLDSRPR